MKEQIEVKEIGLSDKISYVWKTHNYGVAEFIICPVFKRGRMIDLYIYRRQQTEYNGYHIDLTKEANFKVDCFLLSSWIQYTTPPNTWRNYWCKEHKTIAFETYVPPNTNTIEFDGNFGDTLTIRFCQREISTNGKNSTEVNKQ